MKTRYEYEIEVIHVDGTKKVYKQNTRENARDQMALSKSYGHKAKIFQKKYVLAEERQVR